MLLALTQEFSLAVFRSSLKQLIINCPRCLFVSRYSIYKVHLFFAAALADSQIILSQNLPFVKTFFQVFSNFFLDRSASRLLSRALVPGRLSASILCFRRSPERSHILTDTFQFVKHFFHFFSTFFRFFSCFFLFPPLLCFYSITYTRCGVSRFFSPTIFYLSLSPLQKKR